MLASKYTIHLDSSLRLSGTNSNFSYDMGFPPDQQFDRIVVLDALIPKSYYLVQAGYNTFTLQEKGVNTTITVPVGDYLLGTFQSVIQSLLRSSSPNGWTYTLSYPTITTSANTGKYTYSVTGNGGFQPAIIVSSVFFEPFGFSSGSTNTFVSSTLTSTNVIKLQVEDRLYICSNLVSGEGSSGRTVGSVLHAINASSSVDFSTINYQCPCPEYYSKPMNSKNNNTPNFTLTDEHGVLLDLNGLSWQATILCYKENKIYDQIRSFLIMEAKKDEKKDQQKK